MIQYNIPYNIKNYGTITFSKGKKGIVNGTYKNGSIIGKIEGNLLKATFHNTAAETKGLMEITFHENGFVAKWKNGLDPGAMRGKWIGEIEIKNSSTSIQLSEEQKEYLLQGLNLHDFDEEYQGGIGGKVSWLNDKAFLLEAVKQNYKILQYAPAELCADKELIKAAIKIDINAHDYANISIHCDPEILKLKVDTHLPEYKGIENVEIKDEDLNVFIEKAEHHKSLKNLLLKLEYIVLTGQNELYNAFFEKIISFVNKHHECYWILIAVNNSIANFDNLASSSYAEENPDYFKPFTKKSPPSAPSKAYELMIVVRKILDSFDYNIDFEPSNEFETYFIDTEINNSWDDCKWSSNKIDKSLHFSEFIMKECGMSWPVNFDEAKFNNHAIARLWVGLINYSSYFYDTYGDSDFEYIAVCLNSVVTEYYEPLHDYGLGFTALDVVIDYLLKMPRNDFDLNQTDRDDLEDFNGWRYDLKKVGEFMINDINLFDRYPCPTDTL